MFPLAGDLLAIFESHETIFVLFFFFFFVTLKDMIEYNAVGKIDYCFNWKCSFEVDTDCCLWSYLFKCLHSVLISRVNPEFNR